MRSCLFIALFLFSLNMGMTTTLQALPADSQAPFHGTPAAIPGRIEAEDFDLGGEGVAYHDSDPDNSGNAYRNDVDVDIENCDEGGYNVGWLIEGEWLEYTVNVASAGIYQVEVRTASQNADGALHVEFNNVNLTNTIQATSTGGWQNWNTVKSQEFTLDAGQQVMKIVIESSNFNINYFDVKRILNTKPPKVKITSPDDGDKFDEGEIISVEATASDEDGTITKVEFYANASKLGQVETAPYIVTWENAPRGVHKLAAVAFDNDGATTISDSVEVKVRRADWADTPVFSPQHGFFENSFDLTISSLLDSYQIRYTLDCTDPLTSPTATTSSGAATIAVNPNSTNGRAKTPCVTVSAVILQDGVQVSEMITNTYIFLNNVLTQTHPGGDWPNNNVNGQELDYDMDSKVVNDSRYKNDMIDALRSIPSISLVTDNKHLFNSQSGIYVNAQFHGMDWERPVSVELINPDGSEGFQINAGLRIRGGWSRHNDNPKHAFRLFFRDEEYGHAKLKYPLFGDEGVDEFDKVDLRTSQNYAWSFKGCDEGYYNTMTRDVFSRDVQREMGQPYTRSRYYHLYLNGLYWGLFQSQERPEANYAASYMGGNSDDYDVIKVDIGDYYDLYDIEATDGNLDAWQEVWDACQEGFSTNASYFQLQGLNADGVKDPQGKKLVDIDNLIDYMLIIFYTGNFDAPVSKFRSNNEPNNFYAIYNRNDNEGFKFFAHDSEHTLFVDPFSPGDGLYENRVNLHNLDDGYQMNLWSFNKFHPQWLHYKLSENAEYRMRFIDHVYKHFYNNGVFVPANTTKIFTERTKEIEMAIIAESARWGDAKCWEPQTKHGSWLPVVNQIIDEYFPARSDIVLGQLYDEELYTNIDPPTVSHQQVEIIESTVNITPGYVLTLVNPNNKQGNILYTLDGSDPRQIGGAAAPAAIDGGDQVDITINTATVFKARVKNNNAWSALHEITFLTGESLNTIKITEIHYHPLDDGDVDDKEFEFLEIRNTGSSVVNLTNAAFVNGVDYAFPAATTLDPGAYYVIASNPVMFQQRYQFTPDGEFDGQLDNGGERIVMVGAVNDTIINVRYNDKAPWPTLPDSLGYSLVSVENNPTGDPDDAAYWRSSYAVHGSPGQTDTATEIEHEQAIPQQFALYANYPNPFNPETRLSFAVAKPGIVTIKVFDILGREVAVVANQFYSPGIYNVTWRPDNIAGGIYFYQMKTSGFTQSRKLLYLK